MYIVEDMEILLSPVTYKHTITEVYRISQINVQFVLKKIVCAF